MGVVNASNVATVLCGVSIIFSYIIGSINVGTARVDATTYWIPETHIIRKVP